MTITEEYNAIFDGQIHEYHNLDDVDAPMVNPYEKGTLEYLLCMKNWIDTVQWHLEDIIRNPSINPVDALSIKRRIDKSNQDRTDLVEKIDDWFFDSFSKVEKLENAGINTETPAWAIDRLSILALKIYHMKAEAERTDASEDHKASCQKKLETLLIQRVDLSQAIEQLLEELSSGRKYMKLYRQMKMYNDPSLNPILYKQK
ncbi:MAG: DUF4254 domain-containing protein [Alistipes sp.]|nr:DUF4254 domain-containing protein [Candidatus Minthomonas equi]